jgi:translation initiation factor IF-3
MIKKFRINKEITSENIRLVNEDKSSKVITLNEGLLEAQQQQKDLIEIYPDAVPPVCKILNYEKFLYQLQKDEKEQKKKNKTSSLKEVQFSLTIGSGDYKTKLDKTIEFVTEGHKVQLVVVLKKKQLLMTEQAENLLKNIIKDLGEIAKIDKEPTAEKKKYFMIISPVKKKS